MGIPTFYIRAMETVAIQHPCSWNTNITATDRTVLSYFLASILPWSLLSLLRLLVAPLCLIWLCESLWELHNRSMADSNSDKPLPPGNFGFPFVGETLHFLFKGTFLKNKRQRLGSVFKTHLFGRPTIRVSGANNIRRVLMGEHRLVTTQWPTSTKQMLGEGGLGQSLGSVHATRKRAIAKALRHEALMNCLPIMQDIIRRHLSDWCSRGHLLAYNECKNLTLSLAGKLLLGLDLGGVDCAKFLLAYDEFTRNIISFPINLPGFGFNKGMKARELLLSMLRDLLLQKQSQESTDVLSCLLKDQTMSEFEILEAALELLFAGHETTASAACSMLMHLAQNPLVAEKVTTELANHNLPGSPDTQLTYQDVGKLKYTNSVIKEVLRLAPPVGGGFRRALQTFEIEGYQIPKGWTIIYGIRDTHEAAESVGDGATFRPERWLDDEGDSEITNSYMPFGSGQRACVGKEFAKMFLRIFLVQLCRTCSWKLTGKPTTIQRFPVCYPKDKLPLLFQDISAFRRRACTI